MLTYIPARFLSSWTWRNSECLPRKAALLLARSKWNKRTTRCIQMRGNVQICTTIFYIPQYEKSWKLLLHFDCRWTGSARPVSIWKLPKMTCMICTFVHYRYIELCTPTHLALSPRGNSSFFSNLVNKVTKFVQWIATGAKSNRISGNRLIFWWLVDPSKEEQRTWNRLGPTIFLSPSTFASYH